MCKTLDAIPIMKGRKKRREREREEERERAKTNSFKWRVIGSSVLKKKSLYAAMKKNEMLSFSGNEWMELENIILSEVSLAQKTKNRMFSLICGH
jgi:hypothetical protein